VRLAFGALFIKQRLGLSDEETVEQIRENAYMQFFLGFAGYSSKAPFDPSMMVHFRKRFSQEELNRINELVAERGKAMLIDAVMSAPDTNDSDDSDDDPGNQLSLDDFVKPADWPVGKPWGTLTIDASCTPADITYPTDLKLLNEARQSTERIIDNLCDQCSELRKHRPRYDRGRARANLLSVAKQKKPRRHRIKAAIRRQLDYLQRNLDAIDALIASGAGLSGLTTHWWHKLLGSASCTASKASCCTPKAAACQTTLSVWFNDIFYRLTVVRQELLLSLGPRSVFPCGTALPSCTGSAGIYTTRLKT